MTKIVTVVGVGALGSHLVQFLRNEAVAIRVIDFDRVEQKNVQSQFHGKPAIGKKKVDSLKQTMQLLYGEKIQTISNKLVSENVEALLTGDLIVDCLDNAASRQLVQDWVRSHDIPCLHGALAPDGSFGRVVWDEDFVIDSEAGMGMATCEDGLHLPFIAITSAHLARAAQVFFLDNHKIGFSISASGSIRT